MVLFETEFSQTIGNLKVYLNKYTYRIREYYNPIKSYYRFYPPLELANCYLVCARIAVIIISLSKVPFNFIDTKLHCNYEIRFVVVVSKQKRGSKNRIVKTHNNYHLWEDNGIADFLVLKILNH